MGHCRCRYRHSNFCCHRNISCMSKTKSAKKERKVCMRFVVNVLLMRVHIFPYFVLEWIDIPHISGNTCIRVVAYSVLAILTIQII